MAIWSPIPMPRSSATSRALAVVLAIAASSAAAQEDGDGLGFEARLARETAEVESCQSDPGLAEEERLRRASEHFNRGRELYEQGNYAESIREFAGAYCHQPHPAALKNIAQAFERQVEYERAVAYLKRYILELPKSEAQERERTSFRVRVLEGLPARIRVASLPEGAAVTLSNDSGPVATARANDAAPLLVRSGQYTLRVEMAGFEPVEQAITTEIGQPYSFYFRLERKTGTVRVSTNPPDARIFVDQKLVGLGTFSAPLPIGSYEIMVEKGNRPPVHETIEVTADRATNLNVSLPEVPRSGRRELLVASTLFGGFLGGGAFASVFDTDSPVAGLGVLTGFGVGFLGAYFGVPDDISVGRSSAMIGASLWAATEATLVTLLVSCEERADLAGGTSEHCADDRVFFGVGTLAGVGGFLAAAILPDRFEPSAGDAALMNSGAIWGLASGALLWSTFDEKREARDPLLLAGLNVGLIAGGVLAAQSDVSRRRVALIDLGGLAGLLTGVATAELSSEADTGVDRADHFALVGMAAGLIVSSVLTRNIDGPSLGGNLRAQVAPVRDSSGKSAMTVGAALEF